MKKEKKPGDQRERIPPEAIEWLRDHPAAAALNELAEWIDIALWIAHRPPEKKMGRRSLDVQDRALIAAIEEAAGRSGKPFQTLLKLNAMYNYPDEKREGDRAHLRVELVDRIMRKRRQKSR